MSKRPSRRLWLPLLLCISLHGGPLIAQSLPGLASPLPSSDADVHQLYAELLPQIDAIQALDNHSHPGFAEDPDVDAQAAPPDMSEALRVREQNPEHIAAARAVRLPLHRSLAGASCVAYRAQGRLPQALPRD
jgi:hypothetical protein